MKNLLIAFSLLFVIVGQVDAKVKLVGGKGSIVPAIDSFSLEVCRGNIDGMVCENKFGSNSDVDATEDIWSGGGLMVRPSTGRVHFIHSSDGADASAGTGCQTVSIFGVDNDWFASSGTVTMDGTNEVTIPGVYAFINRIICLTFGSGKTNAGTINAVPSVVDTSTSAQIVIGDAQTQSTFYAVAADKDFYIISLWGSLLPGNASGANADMRIIFEENVDGTSGQVNKRSYAVDSGEGITEIPINPPLKAPGRTVIGIRAQAVSATNANIAAGFGGYLIDK